MGRPPIFNEKDLQEIKNSSPHNMQNKWNIVEKYGVSEKTAERTMKKLGLTQTSDRNIEIILRYLNGEQTMALVQEYGMSQVNFNALLRFRGIPARRTQYLFNYKYFEEINTEDKAYFLGFIYADGNLFNNSLKISIRDYDVDVLEKFKQYTDSNHKIRRIPIGEKNFDKKGPEMVEIIQTDRRMPEILNKHGVVPNKTHKINSIPNTVPDKYVKHFIRGYVDGDGSFSRYTPNDGYDRYSFSVVGNIDFLVDLRERIESLTGVKSNKKLEDRHPDRKDFIRSLRYSGKENVLTILNELYEHSTVYMDRKYNKYLDIIK